jgi:hypothetical protein
MWGNLTDPILTGREIQVATKGSYLTITNKFSHYVRETPVPWPTNFFHIFSIKLLPFRNGGDYKICFEVKQVCLYSGSHWIKVGAKMGNETKKQMQKREYL